MLCLDERVAGELGDDISVGVRRRRTMRSSTAPPGNVDAGPAARPDIRRSPAGQVSGISPSPGNISGTSRGADFTGRSSIRGAEVSATPGISPSPGNSLGSSATNHGGGGVSGGSSALWSLSLSPRNGLSLSVSLLPVSLVLSLSRPSDRSRGRQTSTVSFVVRVTAGSDRWRQAARAAIP